MQNLRIDWDVCFGDSTKTQGFVELDQTERFGDIDVVWVADRDVDAGGLPIDSYADEYEG